MLKNNNDIKMDVFRENINQIDNEIIKLLMKRFCIVEQIGKYKKEHILPVRDKEREKLILNYLADKVDDYYDFYSCDFTKRDIQNAMQNIYRSIMEQSCVFQEGL